MADSITVEIAVDVEDNGSPVDTGDCVVKVKKSAKKPSNFTKGRIVKAMQVRKRMKSFEVSLIEEINKFIASGDGISIPKSSFQNLVFEILQDNKHFVRESGDPEKDSTPYAIPVVPMTLLQVEVITVSPLLRQF